MAVADMTWWFEVDLGGESRIAESEECPGPAWLGPYRTFTEAKQRLLSAMRVERDELNSKIDWWKHATKRDILGGG